MKKLYIIFLGFLLPANESKSQCSVKITTSTNTTQLTCATALITLTATPTTTATGTITYLWNLGQTTNVLTIGKDTLYKVTISDGAGCLASDSIYITKDTLRPTVSALALPSVICSGNSATLIATGTIAYSWQSSALPSSLTGAVVSVSPASTADYTVTGTAANGCTANATVTVTVRSLPTATVSGTATVCQNSTMPRITFKGAGGASPYTFAFTVNGGPATQLIATTTGNDTISVGAPTTLPDILSYQLISVTDTNGCTQNQSGNATITVNAGPVLTSAKVESICDSLPYEYTATSSMTATSFSWTRAVVTGISNPAKSGASEIKDTLDNTTAQPVIVSYVFTLSSGGTCSSTEVLKVTVNPTPVINALNDVTACNGTTVPAIAFSSIVSNTTFTWSNDNPNVGLPANGVGNIPSFLARNIRAVPDTANITVRVKASADSCIGKPKSFRIIVGSGPVLTSPKTASVCDSLPFLYTATSSAQGTFFSWTRKAYPGISNAPKAGTATGSVLIRDTLDNTTSNAVDVWYVFQLTTGGTCTNRDSIRVTVNPTPVINPLSNVSFCNRTTVPGIRFTSASPDSSFTWTNSDSSIGLPAAGAGSIPPFVANNNTAKSKSALITVNIKASADKCAGKPATFTITVNPSPPRPVFTSLSARTDGDTLYLCNESQNINFNVTAPDVAVGYKWTSTLKNSSPPLIRDTAHPNTVITFKRPDSLYRIQVTASTAAGCTDSVSQVVKLDVTSSQTATEKIFLMQPGDLLIYPDNSVNTYQWGYDSIISRGVFGPPTFFAGQVRQFLVPSAKIDTTKFLYWVLLQNGLGCKTKVYYNGPYANRRLGVFTSNGTIQMQIIPTLNRGAFTVALKGDIYGRVEARIYTALGNVVFTKSFAKTAPEIYEPFAAGNLPAGLYYMELMSSDLKKIVSRFVIQH